MLPPSDPLQLCALAGEGLRVHGHHNPAQMPVHSSLRADYEQRHPGLLAKVLAKPGGFDGNRACVQTWRLDRGVLTVRTGWRSYTQGLALKEALRQARQSGGLVIPHFEQPIEGLSWGASLVCFVLLPGNRVLAGQRSPAMMTNPGIWSCGFTEILEPTDVRSDGMEALPKRLMNEEIPLLASYGTPRLVGIGVRPGTYTWQLVGVLDLRAADDDVLALVQQLPPDKETVAWDAVDLDGAVPVHDLDTARALLSRLPVTAA